MEDFGNIVYVVAAIAWFAWNTYRKSQNGTQKPSQTNQPKRSKRPKRTATAETRSLEDMILEQLGETRPKPVKHEPKSTYNEGKFLNTDLTHSHLPDDYVMSESEKKSHRVERQVRKLETEKDMEESVFDKLLPDGFDPRQAVVLKAILERPYK